MTNPVHFSSASAEWLTPPHILDRVIELLGAIELDPCAETPVPGQPFNVPAARHYTKADDGLASDWRAATVFMNPPYVRGEIDRWVARLAEQYLAGNIGQAIALLPARVDTRWWQELARYSWCAVRGRLSFGGNGRLNSAPFPSALIYLGERDQEFLETLSPIGAIYRQIGRFVWISGLA